MSQDEWSSKIACPLVFLVVALLFAGCGEEGFYTDEGFSEFDEEYEERRQNLGEFCSVSVAGNGTLSVEEEYLAQVVACENNNAPEEALKAQAIAARTYAKFKVRVENVSQLDSGATHQAYECNNEVQQSHIDAVRATEGMVLTHDGNLTAGFYVSGAIPQSSNDCVATDGDSDEHGMEPRVTYNQGRIGDAVHRAQHPHGHPADPGNRGVMSQEGSSCLAEKGWDYERIFRFYYGDDIRVTRLQGSTCYDYDDEPSPGDGSGGAAIDDGPECVDPAQPPTVVERVEWEARSPNGSYGQHTPDHITIHHTDTTYDQSNPGVSVRRVQNDHMDHAGYHDIGYHYLVSPTGTVYRGVLEQNLGSHVRRQNTRNLGIALIGAYQSDEVPPQAQMRAVARMVRYASEKYDIPIDRTNIKGHIERMNTYCPGNQVMDRFDGLLDEAQADQFCSDDEPTPHFDPDDDSDPSADPNTDPGGGPDVDPDLDPLELEMEPAHYRYVRVRGVSNEPQGFDSDVVDGFEVDGISAARDGAATVHAANVVSSSGVQSASNAVGEPDNTSCDDRTSTVAGVPQGAELVVEMEEDFQSGDSIYVRQHGYDVAGSNCEPSGTAEVSVSPDGDNWKVVSDSVVGNWQDVITQPTLSFASPTSGGQSASTVSLQVDADEVIASVHYYVDGNEIGSSSQQSDQFLVEHEFSGTGDRQIIAVGYDQEGRAVARDAIQTTVSDDFSFISPSDDGWYTPSVWLRMAVSNSNVAYVVYAANGSYIGESTDGANDFAVAYEFSSYGEVTLTARGFSSGHQQLEETTIRIQVDDSGDALRFVAPLPGAWMTPETTLRTQATDPNVAQVTYHEGDEELGTSQEMDADFALEHRFERFGDRRIKATAYDDQGSPLGSTAITVTITNEHGIVPAGSGVDDAESGTFDSATAEGLADEAALCSDRDDGSSGRCDDGTDGHSTGEAWAFVWSAMTRAGVATQSAGNRLASAGPCSSEAFNQSPYGFKCNADANPSVLEESFGLERVQTPATQAPRGAVIAWDRNCLGYSPNRGHIEVSMGDGQACSDYCDTIRGDVSCASVYQPTTR